MSGRDEELIDIIAEEALIDRAKLDPAAKLEDIGLDSVDLVSVVFAIEEKYGIEIAEDAFDRSDTLGAVLTKIDAVIDAEGGLAGKHGRTSRRHRPGLRISAWASCRRELDGRPRRSWAPSRSSRSIPANTVRPRPISRPPWSRATPARRWKRRSAGASAPRSTSSRPMR